MNNLASPQIKDYYVTIFTDSYASYRLSMQYSMMPLKYRNIDIGVGVDAIVTRRVLSTTGYPGYTPFKLAIL